MTSLGDYLRVRTPAVPVRLADGSTRTLRQLSESRAQLLLFVSEGCSSCVAIIAAVPEWRTAMPQIDIRLVVHAAAPFSHLTSTDEPQTIHDSDAWLRETFGTRAMPSALLLGVDGHLAGGPVSGRDAVPAFVEEIGEALSSPRGWPDGNARTARSGRALEEPARFAADRRDRQTRLAQLVQSGGEGHLGRPAWRLR